MKTTFQTICAVSLFLIIGSTAKLSAQQQPPCNCQKPAIYYTPFAPDSLKFINRMFLSLYIGAGEGNANFNALHQFDVYEQLPYNSAAQYSFAINAGKPGGFYISWLMRGSFGSANNYGEKITSTAGYTSFSLGRTIYCNPYHRFLGSISPEIGFAYGGVSVNIASDQPGPSVANAALLNADVSLDLLSWYSKLWHCDSQYGKALGAGCYAITMKLGYAYQLGSSWNCPHVNPDANINMSGFYASLGFSITSSNKWYPR